jgi:hypothetical protein
MKAKPSKARGGRGGEKKKEMPAALPVLEVPASQKQGEPPTFKGIFERLEGARSVGQSLELSYAEVDLIYHRFLSIEQRARSLPASVEAATKAIPAEIWEFISGSPTRGTHEADAERNRKWVDFLSHRGWQYFQRIPDSILLGPSGAEKEAAEAIASLVFLLIQKLRNASRISTPQRFAGRDAAKDAYETVLAACRRTVETSKKRESRNAEYAKQGGKKSHKGHFAFQCEDWARGIIFIHEDWLEDGEGDPPTFAKFPRPMPAKRFGMDAADRAEWENWFFLALEHNIVKAAFKGSSMKDQWRSHRSDLKNRLIPSFWDKAPSWRALREQFAADE